MNKQSAPKTIALTAPRMPKQTNPIVLETLADQETYAALQLNYDELSDQAAEFVTFEGVQFKQITMQRSQLRSLRLTDVRFEACDLAETTWDTLSAHRVEMIGCRLIGWQATNSRIEDLLVKGCNATHAQFWNTSFKRVRFENCNLSQSSFQGADLSGVIFDKCDLRNSKMIDAKLFGADLRNAQIDGVQFGLKELQGAVVNMEQAVYITRALGIDVRLE